MRTARSVYYKNSSSSEKNSRVKTKIWIRNSQSDFYISRLFFSIGIFSNVLMYSIVFSFFGVFLHSPRVQAFVELNSFYSGETFNPGTAVTATKTFTDICLGFSIDNNSKYLVGWNYSAHSSIDTATYSSTQMGPRFLWMITKSKSMSLGLSYNLVTKATYTPASGTTEEWTGTALKVDVGYNFPITESWLIGFRLNYSAATYSSKLVNSTTYSTSSNTAIYTYPSIYSIFLF